MMTLPDEILSTVGPIVESVAADMSRRYHRYGGDQGELAAEGWLWVAEHPEKLALWFDPDLTDPQAAVKLLARSLRNQVSDYGEDLKAQHTGYSRDDLVYYSKNALKGSAESRGLIWHMLREESWTHPELPENGGRSAGDPAEGGNWIATLADVSRAFDTLSEDDRALLRMFHEEPTWRNKDAAKYYGLSEQMMSYKHDTALGRLVKALGGPKVRPEHDADCQHEYRDWSGRRAIGNAQAMAIQASYYEES